MTRTEICLQTIVLVLFVQVASILAYSCPSNWTLDGTNCYQYWDQLKSWSEAENLCQTQGGHLASIATPAENAVVTGLLSKLRTWIGMHEPGNENDRVWSDGLPVTYTNWGDGEPNNNTVNTHDCVAMESNGHWFDIACSKKRRYVCEINATTAAPLTTTQITTLLATSINRLFLNATTVTVYQATTSHAATTATTKTTTTSAAASTATAHAATTSPKSSTVLTGAATEALMTSSDVQTGKSDTSTTHVTDTPTTAAKQTGPSLSTKDSAQGMLGVSQTPSAPVPYTTSTYLPVGSSSNLNLTDEKNSSLSGSNVNLVIGAAFGVVCVLLILGTIVSVVFCRYRRKSDVSNNKGSYGFRTEENPCYSSSRPGSTLVKNPCYNNFGTGSSTSSTSTEESPYYSHVKQNSCDKRSRGDSTDNRYAYAMTEFECSQERKLVATSRVTDNDQKNGSDGRTIPFQSSKEAHTVDEAGYLAPKRRFKELRAAVFWGVAATEEQLYTQIERPH